MPNSNTYDLANFTPFLLAIAAEKTSLAFQKHYKDKYGMLRTEWRVVFHLGQFGPMYAKEICTRAHLHKTKVSRAVLALEKKRFLKREKAEADRRHERLALTEAGAAAYRDLFKSAQMFDAQLLASIPNKEQLVLKRALRRIASLD